MSFKYAIIHAAFKYPLKPFQIKHVILYQKEHFNLMVFGKEIIIFNLNYECHS